MLQRVGPEIFILIPGRTSRQETTLIEGNFTTEYVEETGTLLMSMDMRRGASLIFQEMLHGQKDFDPRLPRA